MNLFQNLYFVGEIPKIQFHLSNSNQLSNGFPLLIVLEVTCSYFLLRYCIPHLRIAKDISYRM